MAQRKAPGLDGWTVKGLRTLPGEMSAGWGGWRLRPRLLLTLLLLLTRAVFRGGPAKSLFHGLLFTNLSRPCSLS